MAERTFYVPYTTTAAIVVPVTADDTLSPDALEQAILDAADEAFGKQNISLCHQCSHINLGDFEPDMADIRDEIKEIKNL